MSECVSRKKSQELSHDYSHASRSVIPLNHNTAIDSEQGSVAPSFAVCGPHSVAGGAANMQNSRIFSLTVRGKTVSGVLFGNGTCANLLRN